MLKKKKKKTFVENHKNLIHVSIHAGVGAGIILDHHLYTGLAGTAGEAGHMIVQPGGRSCPCGNHGCLEQYISEPAVLSRYRELSGRTTVSIDDLVWSYNQKEADALGLYFLMNSLTNLTRCSRNEKNPVFGINNLWNLFLPGMYYPEQSADRLPPSTAPGDFAETFRTFPRYLPPSLPKLSTENFRIKVVHSIGDSQAMGLQSE